MTKTLDKTSAPSPRKQYYHTRLITVRQAWKRAWDMIGSVVYENGGYECQAWRVGAPRPIIIRRGTKAEMKAERNRVACVEAALIYCMREATAVDKAEAERLREEIEAAWLRNQVAGLPLYGYDFIRDAAAQVAPAGDEDGETKEGLQMMVQSLMDGNRKLVKENEALRAKVSDLLAKLEVL